MTPKRCVVVVGAGLAGLAAAQHLTSTTLELDVLVLEADSISGGRVRQLSGLVPWSVEIGPEFLHGKQNSSVMLLAERLKCRMKELPYPDCYYIGREGRFLTSMEADRHPDIQTVHDIFGELGSEQPPTPDVSMLQFLKEMDVNDTVLQLAQSIYANDFGCSLRQLGLGECILEAKQWIYGDTYMILDHPLSLLIDHLSQGLNVLHDHSVEEIVYWKADKVEIRCRGGVKFVADYVISTVPVKVLEEQMIKFDPPLPPAKIKAASVIGMSNAMKILLAFSHHFWPANMFDVVCTDCFVPEFWTTRCPTPEPSVERAASLGKFLLVGFIAGEAAVEAAKLPPEEVLSRALSQLDKIFGKSSSPASKSSNRFHRNNNGFYTSERPTDCCSSIQPASFHFQAGYLVDWSQEKFIRGGYSHPSLHAKGAREALAQPVSGRLFFAGEATHPGVNPCMQAAIDTGVRAAQEVLQSTLHGCHSNLVKSD